MEHELHPSGVNQHCSGSVIIKCDESDSTSYYRQRGISARVLHITA